MPICIWGIVADEVTLSSFLQSEEEGILSPHPFQMDCALPSLVCHSAVRVRSTPWSEIARVKDGGFCGVMSPKCLNGQFTMVVDTRVGESYLIPTPQL